ncbi:MAG TPA: ABC transporter ATP-binding protein [Thermoguttaceae bacterium]|nr:ABC transporter ATP-binding protein [Thermoguttaceae bacterium]
MTEPLIRFHDVDFAYGSAGDRSARPVLHECNFRLDPGQRVALVGPNGSGKTTLLHLVVGLLRPTSGRIEAFGRTRREEADFHEVRRRVGLLFQDSDDQLFCPTVAEDVAFGPLNLGQSRDEVHRTVAETLGMLGLSDYADRVTHKLSGGEKRLVALATVLAMRPEVLMLDEPAAGLDVEATERLVEVLAQLPQTMMIVSHDREFLDRTTTGTIDLPGLPRKDRR